MTKRLKRWEELDHEYDACILGNGASMAVSPSFGYSSLLEEARRIESVSTELEKLFEHLDTVDFEYVLRVLWHAALVNKVFGDRRTHASAAYRNVRNALVQAVRSVHCDYTDAENALEPIGRWLSRFRKVFSLSYDLVVYWAVLRHNELVGRNVFKDCFRSGVFQHDVWESYHESRDGGPDATLVFYPHGHLMLTTNVDGSERKLSARGRGLYAAQSLIDQVTAAWASGDDIPLFVAEGMSEQKRSAIRRSPYLSTVYSEVLSNCGASVVLHGLGFKGEYNDVHILRAVGRARPARVAVSIFTKGGTIKHAAQCDTARGILRDCLGEEVRIDFYDAESEGCWTKA